MASFKLFTLALLAISISVSALIIRSPTCAVCPSTVVGNETTYYLMAASGDAPGTPEFCGYTLNTTVDDMDFFCQYGNTGLLSSDSEAAGLCPSVASTRPCSTPRSA